MNVFQEFFNPGQKNIQFTDGFIDSFVSNLQIKSILKSRSFLYFKKNIQKQGFGILTP
jgi:hypothetical protein